MARQIRLFGTDGIRQKVGKFPLDDHSILKLGKALGTLYPAKKILIGRDTRESGKKIEALFASGLWNIKNKSCEISSGDIIPTPGLSYITEKEDFDFGIMITASHNPYTDNGIKIFNKNGEKIPQDMEKKLEEIFNRLEILHHESETPRQKKDLQKLYIDFLRSHTRDLYGNNKKNKKIVIDCGNGATFQVAPLIFREAGFEPILLNVEPDGRNINRQCGSTYLEPLKEAVLTQEAELGLAFDGDGDRVLFMDNKGRTLNGDHSLYILARFFLDTLPARDFNKVIVGTVMGNLGLEKAFKRMGITYLRTPVGDKYVYQEMKRQHSILGGEESGHTILRNFQKTGDGILTALYFLKSLNHFDLSPGKIFDQLTLYPQVLKNIRIKEKKDLEKWDSLKEETKKFNNRYGENSRLLIRYSGTEPKIRLMIESEHQTIINENIGKFTELIQSAIGA